MTPANDIEPGDRVVAVMGPLTLVGREMLAGADVRERLPDGAHDLLGGRWRDAATAPWREVRVQGITTYYPAAWLRPAETPGEKRMRLLDDAGQLTDVRALAAALAQQARDLRYGRVRIDRRADWREKLATLLATVGGLGVAP
jgi:hypothetical protein